MDHALVISLSCSLLALTLLYCVYQTFLSDLARYPGPLLAKITNLWRLRDVWKGQSQHTLRKLHKQHGSIVRVGPDFLSLSDTNWIPMIYSIKGDFKKSEMYTVNDIKLPDGMIFPTLFSVRDNQPHAQMKKPIQKLYNLTHVLTYEERIDEVLSTLVKTLESFADGRVIDIGDQLLYAAYDVMANMTFGAPDGYLGEQSDFAGILETSDRVWDYFARVSQLPWLDHWLAKSDRQWVANLFPSFAQTMHRRCIEYITARIQESEDRSPRDYLEDFIRIGGGRKEPDWGTLVSWLGTNVVAGSDTVAIQLKAAVYYVLKNPEAHKKLKAEIDAAKLTLPLSYDEAKTRLPYLDAVIKESMRLHPGVGLLLERRVPEGGIQLPDGPYLRGGLRVGVNAWVTNLDDVFGPDPEDFIPERWLAHAGESPDDHAARVSAMNKADLSFGSGRRVCLGKSIALVEMFKILGTTFLMFDMQLAHPEKEWEVMNSWFTRQNGIEVFVKRRAGS